MQKLRKIAGIVVQVVECLPSKPEALSLKKKKKDKHFFSKRLHLM
jgi:hypothetical protein